MKKIKSKKAYCIVEKINPVISAFELYDNRDITLNKSEEIWEVIIMPTKKVRAIHR